MQNYTFRFHCKRARSTCCIKLIASAQFGWERRVARTLSQPFATALNLNHCQIRVQLRNCAPGNFHLQMEQLMARHEYANRSLSPMIASIRRVWVRAFDAHLPDLSAAKTKAAAPPTMAQLHPPLQHTQFNHNNYLVVGWAPFTPPTRTPCTLCGARVDISTPMSSVRLGPNFVLQLLNICTSLT